MNLAYQYGADRIWIVNVGDLKPMELPISFFLDYAWNPEKLGASKLNDYTVKWAKEQFGEKNAIQISEILDLYTKYNSRRKPELLSSNTYSLIDYREFENVVNDFNKLVKSAEMIYKGIDENQKDAFYQLIFHPVAASANLNEMYYFQALNHLYASQGRAATNDMAKKVKELFIKDAQLSDYYNTNLSDGKWNHMMDQAHISYTYWQQPDSDIVPLVKEITVPQDAGLGVFVEGSGNFWPDETTRLQLPEFDSYNNQSFYIELFNTGKAPFSFQLSTSDKWIQISNPKGKIVQQTRIQISINWKKLKTGYHLSQIDIKSDKGETVQIEIRANKYDEKLQKPFGFMERNGVLSIEAANYSKAIDNKEFKWQVIPGFGRTNSGITTTPVTKSIQKPGGTSPSLEYCFYLLENPKDGKIKVNLYFAPTLDFHPTGGLKYGISIDGEEPQIINMHQAADIPDYKNPQWWTQAVSDNIIIKSSDHILENSGHHVLKFWLVDPGIVLQKIVIDNGGLKPSYLGPPESKRINN
jgi:hypothetical protein